MSNILELRISLKGIRMKKIGLGIAILLFALVFHTCSFGAGMDGVTLALGFIGFIFAVSGFLDKNN